MSYRPLLRQTLMLVILGAFFPVLCPAAASQIAEIPEALVQEWTRQDEDFRARTDSPGPPAFSLEHLQDIVRRARELALRLHQNENVGQLNALTEQIDAFALPASDASEDQRRQAYLTARALAREIAFCNPLLDFDQLLFIKRHDAKGVFHMCDQFYGFNAVSGGGLFILHEPFGPNPRLENLLERRPVALGRLQGQSLTPGAVLSPDLSWDGHTILFAYSKAGGKDLEWTPESCYHLFSIQSDGSGLTQLTDGPFDDFDPCFLPNGRIAFVSERCGGFLRCGRHCPTYTLFSMNPDGSDIQPLSHHETHEWQPSVANDGMLVYTRWDYVDRDTNIAHHLWTSYPDGRDPRSMHGNYPEQREGRPWMEMDIRAIPNSQRFVAVAAAHHGHAFGSLVMINPQTNDDGAMAQITRLTPDVPFPEAEKEQRPIPECMVYGTPWPLSEDDYLCVYDRLAKNRGIYWIDRFGNRELLYRDPAISCLSPMPLSPRTKPPIIPSPLPGQAEAPATAAVMNIYSSDFHWPSDTHITALRIIEVLPKTTPPPNEPRIGVADQTNARAILGTVPVESDGSAYFCVPPEREIYFQALDENGMAIQSMRSGTYLHAGERLTCIGCHEPKRQAPDPNQPTPQALRRSPSPIRPEPDGSNPFNYVRLVQPVLDRHCVACHQEKKALDLAGIVEGPYGWSRSYQNLASKYGFYFNVRNGSFDDDLHGGSRTDPGRFGAKAALLLPFLAPAHYGVLLPPEDRRRITLWLDANSEFFGAYENTPAQSRGEIVEPSMH